MTKKTNKTKKGSKPQETQPQINQKHTVQLQQASFTGPLPQPVHFEHYDRICPGAAGRILAMAEKEQGHQHEMEGKAVSGEICERRLGQILAFSIAVVTIFTGAYTAILGAEIAGGLSALGA